MATKKTFDCVEMKRQAQKRLREEYAARRGEFASFIEFINVTARESELGILIREKSAKPRAESH